MMQTKDIKDYIKSATTVTSPDGKNLLMKDANGNLLDFSAVGYASSPVSLAGAEPGGATLDVVEFAKKYGDKMRLGRIFNDSAHLMAIQWNVKLNDSITLSTQAYTIMVTKLNGNISSPWGHVGLLFLPSSSLANGIYFVFLQAQADPSNVSKTVKKILLS